MNHNRNVQFNNECQESIVEMGQDASLKEITQDWFLATCKHKYSYNFTWMGRPIIQYPQDMIAMQEVIWKVKPDLIWEFLKTTDRFVVDEQLENKLLITVAPNGYLKCIKD